MKQFFCLGSYTESILFGTGEMFRGKGAGVSICAFEDGRIETLSSLAMCNPSFVCLNEKKQKIYAVNEAKEFQGAYGGGITQIAYDETSRMYVEAALCTGGADPCHVALAPDGRFVTVANFADGRVSVFPVNGAGSLVATRALFQHTGRGADAVRQSGSHAHSAVFAPDAPLVFVPGLGTDRVEAYRWEQGCIIPQASASITVAPGSGPRVGVFHPNGGHFYLANELSSRVMHFSYANGVLHFSHEVSTLPDGCVQESICADLHLSADGAFLYASNRGHDSIAVFRILPSGEPKFVECVSCGGRTPRNFAIDPTGHYLLAANQDSDSIVVFSIEDNGCLSQKQTFAYGSPVCIRFFTVSQFLVSH